MQETKYSIEEDSLSELEHTRLVTLQSVVYIMPADFDTFRSVLFYCVAILALPISTFFLAKFILFDEILHLDNIHSNVYSAIGAIIVLHVSLGIFIYKAYSTDEVPKKPEKLD